jgi:asparagine synthase (glutamine-hydrolysing)
LIWHEDEPIAFTSSIPLNILSRLAGEHVKVVLTGEGADELFLGYDYRYRVTYWNRRIGEVYSGLLPVRLREMIANSVTGMPRSLRRYAERTFLALDTGPRELFFENFSVFQNSMRQELLHDTDLLLARDPYAESMRHYRAAGTQALQCMSHADIHTYLVELLMKQDQMSMAASIESRVPFLDHRLVEQVASLPMRHKFRGWQTKALFRDAVKDIIPKEILTMKKMGFPVPISGWLRSRFWPMVEEFVLGQRALSRQHFKPAALTRLAHEHRSGYADHGERLWLLINLEIWQRIFVDGESPSEIYTSNTQSLKDTVKRASQPTLAPMV